MHKIEKLREEGELRLQAHPHTISGAMDFEQRLEFFAFRTRLHQRQVEGLVQTINPHS